MTSTSGDDRPITGSGATDVATGAEVGADSPTAPASRDSKPGRLQDDPRAKLALARKSHAANPTAATGAGHTKAANESSKQGKKEKKVRW